MFGKKDNEVKKNVSSNSNSSAINSLAEGAHVEGTVRAASDMRIDGTLIGTIHCDGRLIVGPTGVIEGTINCTNAVIEGKIDGKLKVEQMLHVKETATITGEVVTDKLIVQADAVFNVQCQMGGQVISGFGENTDAVAS